MGNDSSIYPRSETYGKRWYRKENKKGSLKYLCLDTADFENLGTPSWSPNSSPQSKCSIVRTEKAFVFEGCRPSKTFLPSKLKHAEDRRTHQPSVVYLGKISACGSYNVTKDNNRNRESKSIRPALESQYEGEGFEASKLFTDSYERSVNPIKLIDMSSSVNEYSDTCASWSEKKRSRKLSNTSRVNVSEEALTNESVDEVIMCIEDAMLHLPKVRDRSKRKKSSLKNWKIAGWTNEDEIVGLTTIKPVSKCHYDLDDFVSQTALNNCGHSVGGFNSVEGDLDESNAVRCRTTDHAKLPSEVSLNSGLSDSLSVISDMTVSLDVM